MSMSAWEVFDWVRSGEGGGKREGYSSSMFHSMTNAERNKASEVLQLGVINGEPFATQGLVLCMGLSAIPFLRQAGANAELAELARANIFHEIATLSKLENDLEVALSFLDSSSSPCKWEAIYAAIETGLQRKISSGNLQRLADALDSKPLSNLNFQITDVIRNQIKEYAPSIFDQCSAWLDKVAYSDNRLEVEFAKVQILKYVGSI